MALRSMGVSVDLLAVGKTSQAGRGINDIVNKLRKDNIALVHAHDFTATLICSIAIALSGHRSIRLYSTIHGYEGYPIKRRFVLAHRLAYLLSRRVINVGSYIDKWYGTHCNVVIHGGVTAAPPSPKVSVPMVVFVSRLAPDTCAVEVAEALSELAKERPSLRVIIGGFGPCESEVRAIIDGVTNIDFIGTVSDPPTIIKSASIVVANSYLAILEALSLGKPVASIASNPLKHDYLKEIADASGGIVVTSSKRELVSKVVELLDTSTSGAREMGEAGKAYSARMSWENIAKDYRALWSLDG